MTRNTQKEYLKRGARPPGGLDRRIGHEKARKVSILSARVFRASIEALRASLAVGFSGLFVANQDRVFGVIDLE
jgi:hypothetical protein